MTTYNPTEVNADALPADTLLVGVDAKDAVHRYSRHENTVYVGDAGADTLAAFDLDEYPADDVAGIEGWVGLTKQRRGWAECRYVRDWGQHMAETLQEAGV
ncbi:hypothetical protein SAMN05216388_1017116 [Halorientalis persicus]|uniref:Uncharacterized protein n=1 Tax=Halorientalis persicus TaxID=1367881 RepID=A0A1H8S2B6_9EURY|nr:hypothetical protein [Halorientalis persicus]SEO72574.1 hypothetical protein SAMN05216388_1017116 [Halorientalis persicus]